MQHLAQEQGCTIVLVTHDNRILNIGSRNLHIEDNRLLQKLLVHKTLSAIKHLSKGVNIYLTLKA